MEISSGRLTAPCLPLPLRTRTSPAPTRGLATLSRYPPALLGLQRQRKALPNSQPTCSQASGLGWPPPLWGAPSSHRHPLLWCLDVVAGSSPRGRAVGLPGLGHRTTPICSGSLCDTLTSTSPAGCLAQGLPSRPHPSVPGAGHSGELAAPTSVTGSLRTSNVTPGQFGGQWLPREAPRTPDA